MNELVIGNKELTMSSREIADLVEKRHDNVKRTIETLSKQGIITLPQIEKTSFIDKAGKTQWVAEYRLAKRDTYIVVAQLSPEFTARLVDRWQELESKQAFDPMQALNDPATMRGLLLNYSEKVLCLEQKVSEMTPQVDALQRISASHDTLTMTQASKVLGIKRNVLITKLHAAGWIYRQNGSWVAYDQYIKNGCLVYKEASYTDENTELQTIRPYCHLTQKGLSRLAMEYSPDNTVAEAA